MLIQQSFKCLVHKQTGKYGHWEANSEKLLVSDIPDLWPPDTTREFIEYHMDSEVRDYVLTDIQVSYYNPIDIILHRRDASVTVARDKDLIF